MTRQQRRAKHRELRKALTLFHAGRITKAQLDRYTAELGFVKRSELAKRDRSFWAKAKAWLQSFGGARA